MNRRGFIARRVLVASVCVLPLAVLIALLSTGVMSRGMLQGPGWVALAQCLHPWTDGGNDLYPCQTENVIVGASSQANADHLLLISGSAIFNEQGADADCRIEGDTDAYLISTDASTDRVGVGLDRGFEDPVCKLHVQRSHLGAATPLTTGCVIAAQHNGSTDNDCDINILCGDTGTGGLYITDADTDPNATSGHLRLDADSGLMELEATTGSLKLTGDSINLNGGQKVKRTAVTTTYTALVTDYLITCSGTTGYTVSLPAAATAGAGTTYMFANVHSATYNITITIDPNGGELINGNSTASLGEDKGMTIVTDGSDWYITGQS